MEPTLITLYAGGNDILDFGTDIADLMDDYEYLVARLAASGATVVLFTGFDVKVSALLEPLKKRNAIYNRRVREMAARYGAVLVDYWCFDAFHDPRMWDSDRLHMSKAGHKYLAGTGPGPSGRAAQNQAQGLGAARQGWASGSGSAGSAAGSTTGCCRSSARKFRGVTLGDQLRPRWPEPVKVPRKGGLKKLPEDQRDRRPSRGAGGPAGLSCPAGFRSRGHPVGVELHDLEIGHAVDVERVLGQGGVQVGAVRVGQQQRPGARDLAPGDHEDAARRRRPAAR